MNTALKITLIVAPAIALAAAVGTHLGGKPAITPVAHTTMDAVPPRHQTLAAPPLADIATKAQDAGKLESPEALDLAWSRARTLEEWDPLAQQLAEQNTAQSVQSLLNKIEKIKDWSTRAALAKNLCAVSDPECLQALLPALLNNYGRGNTILNEISDTIGRLALPETVEDLAALHWQASVQAGQGHKVLRTVAMIRNPAALRGLMRVAARDDSPALAAAAHEAVNAIHAAEAETAE